MIIKWPDNLVVGLVVSDTRTLDSYSANDLRSSATASVFPTYEVDKPYVSVVVSAPLSSTTWMQECSYY